MSAVWSTDRDKRRTIQKLQQAAERSFQLVLAEARKENVEKVELLAFKPAATVATPSRDVHDSVAKH
ncbi:hypothetical protein DPMN_083230 [Dreissena polymorpha]|uniref:Uncharacterized protein n=1 Tax=Dreissena polymorpha TaxID=45954 RepID=A0A9D3YBI2_DREPO|nr:hypothetical protein DPMN_083230 [Dreissena polymorpha]